MKKVILILVLFFLTGCAPGASSVFDNRISIVKPPEQPITQKGSYALDCSTKYYSNIAIGGNLIPETFIKISEGHERDTLYVENETAKFFGADYQVIQDNDSHLIIMRYYGVSGLTEVVSIDKKTGIGFDTKTLTLSISGAPNTDTYLLSCLEV